MDLRAGVNRDRVVVHGYTQRIPRVAADYPELWERAWVEARDALARRIERAGSTPVSDLSVWLHYEKRVELEQRPDWAEGIDPPWTEYVETTGPDWDTAVVIMEVACV